MLTLRFQADVDPAAPLHARRLANFLLGVAEGLEAIAADAEDDEDLDEPDDLEKSLIAEAEQAVTIGSRSCCQPSRCHTENRQPTTDNSPAAPLANPARMAAELGQVQGHLSEILEPILASPLPLLGTVPKDPGKLTFNGVPVSLGDAERFASYLSETIKAQRARAFALHPVT